MIGLRVSRPTWWTPSVSMTVPSAKTWRNMPNWWPSSERLSVTRVTIGSDSVNGRDTRGRGMIRGVAVGPEVAGVETSVAGADGVDVTGRDGPGDGGSADGGGAALG